MVFRGRGTPAGWHGAAAPLGRQENLSARLEFCLRRGHHRVALRYFFMLDQLGLSITAHQRQHCEAAMQRRAHAEVQRIREQVRAWMEFARPAAAPAPESLAFADLVAEVLRRLTPSPASSR